MGDPLDPNRKALYDAMASVGWAMSLLGQINLPDGHRQNELFKISTDLYVAQSKIEALLEED